MKILINTSLLIAFIAIGYATDVADPNVQFGKILAEIIAQGSQPESTNPLEHAEPAFGAGSMPKPGEGVDSANQNVLPQAENIFNSVSESNPVRDELHRQETLGDLSQPLAEGGPNKDESDLKTGLDLELANPASGLLNNARPTAPAA